VVVVRPAILVIVSGSGQINNIPSLELPVNILETMLQDVGTLPVCALIRNKVNINNIHDNRILCDFILDVVDPSGLSELVMLFYR
jgi:hypothetical protein